jgi:aspartyl-tRNA(Asn)/glutamyl-tRNA(Gln) amidotransferase subunit C
MAISKEQVQHVAHLARLSLTEKEVEQFTTQLNDILHFAEKLNELDTDNVEPTTHVLPLANVLREDEVRPSISRDKALANAPEKRDGMFRVPAVFEE